MTDIPNPTKCWLYLKEDKSTRVTPSVYTQEMLKSTEERLANTNKIHRPHILELLDMSQSTNYKVTSVGLDQALFQPYPSDIVFQNFTPGQTYKLPLLLLNNDKVSRKVKVELQDSEYFHVNSFENVHGKIAPGFSANFTVIFTPQESKDYHSRLVCVTDREKFEVPILAIGPRAILDFRDELNLPLCVVKASTEKTHLVRNIGNSKAKFKLHTEKPFSVTPSSGTLEVGESMQVTVEFHPLTIGSHSRDLLLHYHTGEDVYISLNGVCEELDVHLYSDSVLLMNTYISLASVYTVPLTNTGEVPIKYRWTMWPTQKQEDQDLRESSELEQKEEKQHVPVLSREIQEHTDQATKDHLLAFSDSCITMEPVEGEIWPKVTAYFKIVFKPKEAKVYQQTIYCDITGRESRLPLTIKGEGMGPVLKLKYNLMDMKNVFIGNEYNFEMLLSNLGLIDAPFRLSSPDTTCGRCFSFSPEEGVVPAGACRTFEVSFNSQILGTFSEELLLFVTGQPQPLTLTFRGCVIGPTFHFNVSELNFGDVAFGFPQTLICTLFNTSFVAMTFALRVQGDGLGSPSITSTTQVSQKNRNNWQGSASKGINMQPVEFTVSPAAGSVRAMSDINIKVTLCSNTVKQYRVALVVDVEGVGKEITTVPINARCVVPEIVVGTPVLDFQSCFLDYPYHQKVRLTNPCNLPACFGVLEQEFEEGPSMIFGSSKKRGVIPPHSSEELPVFMLAKAVGRLNHTLRIVVFGSVQSPLEVVLSCIGKGPVVLIENQQLNFGKIPVLTDVTRTLHLSNGAPITAYFTAFISNQRSFWRVEPNEGKVPPQSQVELKVVAHIKDTIRFQESLKVSIQDSETYTILLSATGTGTTIVSDSPFGQNIDLGTKFSHALCQYYFKLTNHGLRSHRLYWGTDGILPPTKTQKGKDLSRGTILPPISAPSKKVSPVRQSFLSSRKEKIEAVFTITPSRVELLPGCSVDMLLTGSSDSPKVVQERLVCRGIVGNQGSYEHIMFLNVSCHFVAPLLSISAKSLNFYIEKIPGKSPRPLYEKLVIKNVSTLCLSMELTLLEPFSLCEAPGDDSSSNTKSIVLGDGKQAEVWVCFNFACCQERVSRVFNELLEIRYEGHPQQDMVELHAEVHFPNLHFSSTTVNFGCVLDCIDNQQTITITNCSPLPVSYKWTFLEENKESTVRVTETLEEEEKQKDTDCDNDKLRVSTSWDSAGSGPNFVNKVFDILPWYGHLKPQAKQIVKIIFNEQKHISREVMALCHVQDGPKYEIKLKGEASTIQYSLDSTHIDFGLQLFDRVGKADFTIRNTGRIGFNFIIKHPNSEEGSETAENIEEHKKYLKDSQKCLDAKQQIDEQNDEKLKVMPGQPLVIPSQGCIDAGMVQRLRVLYLPGIPEVFEKHFQLQVAFLPPQDVTLTGEGVFPRIRLNLPQNLSGECYSDVVQPARAVMEANTVKDELTNGIITPRRAVMEANSPLTYVELLHMETERRLVKENALAVADSLLELRDSQSSFKKWHKLSKFQLPEYVLDFGYVIPGKSLSHTVNITNSGLVPVSFFADSKPLAGTGFSVEFERVKNLPPGETQTFKVRFDPQAANEQTERLCVTMLIKLIGGPIVPVQMSAAVIMPAITVSTDELLFDLVQCGMCQMKTIELCNQKPVPCQWRVAEERKPLKRHRKVLEEQHHPPVMFEMLPNCGTLSPGERINVLIKFSPTEGQVYKRRLEVSVAKSTQQMFIRVQGQGEEPKLQFCPPDLELGPCLPGTDEIQADITVRNPCSFPIEFYCLEFDKQYLNEEKILRLMKDYDDNNVLLLPPRLPGESLPTELTEYYNEYCSRLNIDAEKAEDLDRKEAVKDYVKVMEKMSKQGSIHSPDGKREEKISATSFFSEINREGTNLKLEQLEMTPVSRALARYMSIDLSPNTPPTSNLRGIAIVVYGRLQTGSTANDLAQRYGGACLSVDAVVTDVLMNGNSPVGLIARQLHDPTVAEYTERKAQKADEALEDTTNQEPLAHFESSDPAPNSGQAQQDVKASNKPTNERSSRNDCKTPQDIDTQQADLCQEGDFMTSRKHLPEQMLVDILAERFQLSDCHNCVVVDGLKSMYTQSEANTLQVVLKALSNRKHIYVVYLSISPAAEEAYKKAQRENEVALEKEKVDKENQWLQDLDEEQYESLPDEQKEHISQRLKDNMRQQSLRVHMRTGKLQEKQQERKSLKYDELKKQTKTQGKNDNKEVFKKITPKGKQCTNAEVIQRRPSSNNPKKLIDLNEGQQTNSKDLQKEDANTLITESTPPTDKVERGKSSVGKQSYLNGYEEIQKQVDHILQNWDIDQGLLLVPLPNEEALLVPDDPPADKQTLAGRKIKKAHKKALSLTSLHSQTAEFKDEEKGDAQNMISHIVIKVTELDDLLRCSSLLSLDEVFDDLSTGASKSPIPSTINFSIVPFPEKREDINTQPTCECFTFLNPIEPEEQVEMKKDSQEDLQALDIKEEAATTASNIHAKGTLKENVPMKEKDKKIKDPQARKRAVAKMKAKDLEHLSLPPPPTSEQDQSKENKELRRKQRSLSKFRWVVPAKGEVVLKIWFYSDTPGKFEQVFNFELLGTRKNYPFTCRGICIYPSICNDYKTIFATTKKVQEMEEGLQKTYIINPGYFEYGPLICGKTRDRWKEATFKENTQRLIIHNNSALNAEVQFSFQHDNNATTYLLDPPTMSLSPDQKQELEVWAYPTVPGQIKDSVVCSIKDNPKFVIINLSCWGIQPKLELDTNLLHFDRILLHRQDMRTLTMYNRAPLPLSWKLQGLKELGDEFNITKEEGKIPPESFFTLDIYFCARKPLNIKKTLRLEVYDEKKILGILHTENIAVTAEAYDIALDISHDGHLYIGKMRVFGERKLSLSLKNRGKYRIDYKFTFEQKDLSQSKLQSMFTISPNGGSLMPNDKSKSVEFTCIPTTEVFLKEQPILRCQVVDTSLGSGGEVVGNIPIQVSLQSVFTRYKITPACDINFGPLVYGCKKTQSFTIENNGIFETNFAIYMVGHGDLHLKPGTAGKKPRDEDVIRVHTARAESPRKNIALNRLNMGVFSVFPCMGNLQPGSHRVVTVECVADQLGEWNQGLLINISHCDPSDHPMGIPYKLLAQVLMPVIALDMASIFEEHHLCHNSRQLSSEQYRDAESIFLLVEKRFIFNKVIVGRTAQARFKLTNSSKVPCELSLAIKYGGNKALRNIEVFNLCAKTLNIPTQSHSYAVVTFTPQTMQLYSAVFEATVESAHRKKVLEFDLYGEGTLPSVCVLRPSLKNNKGNPVLQFRQLIVGRRKTLPLVILNDGTVPAQVQIDMLDEHGVFTFNAASGNSCTSIYSKKLKDPTGSGHQLVHRAILSLNSNEQMEFEVSFCSDKPLSVKATMSLQVQDNQYNNTTIQVTGKAYQEIVSLNKISRSSQEMTLEEDDKGSHEVLNFGDCVVNFSYQESITMINHSSSQVVRFEWPPGGPYICFSPQVGHLHAGCSKAVTVTFSSKQPAALNSQLMSCKVCEVEFKEPLEEVPDWDDRQRTVQWLRASQLGPLGTDLQNSTTTKVIKTDPEPCCSFIEGSQWELELCVSAVCDYVKFSCNTDTIQFRDTLLCQTRLHKLHIVNQGIVKLEFSWDILLDPGSNIVNNDQRDRLSTSRPGSRSASALAGVRPTSALATVMSLLMRNPELPPFSIEPSVGTILPGAVQEFIVRFSPLKVDQFQGRLMCSINNLRECDQAPCISLCGCSLLPHCHFDLEQSDYISGNRRSPEFKSSLDPNTRVIEFQGICISAPVTRCFGVVNPTNIPYSFKWKCKDKGYSSFLCLTKSGTILPGKKVEMCFKYLAEQLDTVESVWTFVIETLSMSFPFLCVGSAREPAVYFRRPYLDLGELLVGRKVEQTVDLVNGESGPFSFSVLQSSLLCEDQVSTLTVQPMTGNVAPSDRFPLSVSFTPSREGYVSFRLVVFGKSKLNPLTLTVKADCFTMSTLVEVENPDGGFREIKPNHEETLEFGNVGISEQSVLHLLVSNMAKFNMEVNFELTGPSELLQYLGAKTQNGVIEVGKQLKTSLMFSPQSVCNLKNVKLNIKIKHGPTFTITIKGSAVAPRLEFSFTEFNFGKNFLYVPGMVPTSKTLVISNKGKRGISIQSKFNNTAFLEMDFRPSILSPGDVMEVPLTFYPRETGQYYEQLTFILNSCVTKHVNIRGQGIEMKLEVGNPKQRKVKFESLLGQKVTKQVTLVNRSSLDLSFSLVLNTNAPLDPKDLTFSPSGELTLKARGGSCNVEIQFLPCQRIPLFTGKLLAQFEGLSHPLLTIEGCCKNVEVKLDQDCLAFGAVVQCCQARKKVVMMNTGDLGARFNWNTKNLPPELSISPAEGYISPGMEVPFLVTFAPEKISSDIRYENLSCFVEGSSSLIIHTVTGSCIVAPTNKEVIHFVCPVRASHTQTLSVLNPTNQHFSIRPVLEGEQWSALPFLTFEPLQNKTYEITYRPLTMTADGKKHQGSAFFSFPDGTAVLYSLQGTADPPKAENTVVQEVPAKTQHTQKLPVHNWLTKQQRFHVLTEILKPDKPDATVSLKGLEYIDVPALSERDYNISFFSYREGQYNTKVTFSNKVTGEYLFYLITFKATSPGVLSTIELEATVRRIVTATVQVENPLSTATDLTTECKCTDISAPSHHTVPGKSKCPLSFEYQPQRAGKSTTRLTLYSNELGYFHYDLLLQALPPPPEKPVHFSASLGSSHSVVVKFINYSRAKTEYSCKTDCPDFTVEKSVTVPPGFQAGSEASVAVCFEPHQLGEVRGQLSLSSGTGGEYIFPLCGICVPPKAQGPFSIRAGRNITIPFKNVFLQTIAFSYQLDNPCFSVKGVDTILSKKTQNVTVSFEAPAGGNQGPWFGRLTISTQLSEGHSKLCSWVYYLKGHHPESP